MDPERRAMRFRVAPEVGPAVVGVVQGAFGALGDGYGASARGPSAALARLRAARDLAEAGRPHELHEPRPGCIAVMPEYGAAGRGPVVVVSLIGACVSIARDEKVKGVKS